MEKCRICGCTDFYKESGYFFCETCQTQSQEIREEVIELPVDNTTRLRKTKIRQLRSDKPDAELGWTSWELYNFVLIGLTNELIELGVPSEIKLTILQLWATYLGKLEVAFISTRKKCIPKLARRYKERDAEIIYGKAQSQKSSRKRKRAGSSTNTSVVSVGPSEGNSSMREINKNKKLLATLDYNMYLQSQGTSDGEDLSMFGQSSYSAHTSSVKSFDNEGKIKFSSHAKEEARKIKRLSKNLPRSERVKYRAKHTSTQYKMGPHIITPMRLWAIIYLALRIHDQPIHLADMLRYGREGHLSYYKLDHLLPPEIKLTPKERSFLTQNIEITHKGMRRITASMAKFIGVWDIVCPDLLSLVTRYCQELGLPKDIQLYTERLIALSPPIMTFDAKTTNIPNYEGRAIAFIIVVLKILLALDDITEYHISRIAEKINSIAIKRGLLKEKLFSFEEWQRYIECRKTILAHAHFPTKMKYNSESNGIDDLCLKFAEFITSKSNKNEAEMKSSKHTLPVETIVAMTRHITNLNINDPLAQTVDIFPASLTPLHSYLEHLLDHPFYDIPSVARNDFFRTKVEYMIKTDTLIELAKKCDLDLEVIDLNAHFLEKNVPPFEQSRMPSIEELKQLVDVQDDLKHDTGSESLNDYLHSKTLCTIKLDVAKEQYYSKVGTAKNSDDINLESDFSFTETLPDGRLAIPAFDSEDEEENSTEQVNQERILLDKEFCSKYNIQLSCTEKESIRKLHTAANLLKKPKVRFERNAKGQFVRKIETSDDFSFAKENVNLNNRQTNAEIKTRNIVQKQSLLEDININDIDIDNTELNIELFDENDCFNLSDISILNQNHDAFVPAADKINLFNEKHRFFKPFREYWMHHCVFSLVRPKNFSMFERSLPRSFRWLLNECALIVEMSTQDLYEEICLIESYHSQNPKNKDRSDANSIPKNQWNFILNKW